MRLQTAIHLVQPWSTLRDRTGNQVVFLLGAGASRDAQLPLAAEVTRHWRSELCRRVEGAERLLVDIDRLRTRDHSGTVEDDYEEIFWWLQTLSERKPLRELMGIDSAAYEDLHAEIALETRDILTSFISQRERAGGDVSYLARLVEFASEGQPIEVFTLNYDTCVERACRSKGIPIVTGFDGPDRRRGWQPELFRRKLGRGSVYLYKLHGSLSWFGSDPNLYEDLDPPDPARNKSKYDARPHLVLGPTAKVQTDDPFWWLLDRFHAALQQARTCVLIGFGGRDPHIAQRIAHERSLGLNVIDVGPAATPVSEPLFHEPNQFEVGVWIGVDRTACDALASGLVDDAIREIQRLRFHPSDE